MLQNRAVESSFIEDSVVCSTFLPGTTTLTGTKPLAMESHSNKSRLVALLLCWFLGIFGAHRFYVGKVGTGILQLVTFGGLGIWTLIDLILIVVGSFRDAEGQLVFQWTEPGA